MAMIMCALAMVVAAKAKAIMRASILVVWWVKLIGLCMAWFG